MKLIKIDPQNRTVEAIETPGTLQDMYEILDCRMIDVCARQDNGDALTIDDEALFLEPQPAAFSYNGYGRIHGVALLTGCDEEGETCEPTATIDEVIRNTKWLGGVHTIPFLTVISLSPFQSASR
jgi:hypothetical protein